MIVDFVRKFCSIQITYLIENAVVLISMIVIYVYLI